VHLTAVLALVVAAFMTMGLPALIASWYGYLALVVFGLGLLGAILFWRKLVHLPP
jgi:hypothetical protein